MKPKDFLPITPLIGTTLLTFGVFCDTAQAITLVTNRTGLSAEDRVIWSSATPATLFPPVPNSVSLPNTFSASSQGGLNLSVNIPVDNRPGMTPPLVFQTLASPTGIPTNFASGDYILFTGLIGGPPPASGNVGPVTLNFSTSVSAAGAQIAVDDATGEYSLYLSAYDVNNNLLGTVETTGTSSTALDNSAAFLGVLNNNPTISKIVFSSSVADRALGINDLSLRLSAVPESSNLIGLGLLGLGLITVKRHRYP